MLEKLKLSLQISSNDFDSELEDLIEGAKKDLGLSNVTNMDETDKLVGRAIISYCSYQFELMHGNLNRAEAMKKAYDEQKSMLGMSTGYTTWSENE